MVLEWKLLKDFGKILTPLVPDSAKKFLSRSKLRVRARIDSLGQIEVVVSNEGREKLHISRISLIFHGSNPTEVEFQQRGVSHLATIEPGDEQTVWLQIDLNKAALAGTKSVGEYPLRLRLRGSHGTSRKQRTMQIDVERINGPQVFNTPKNILRSTST